METVPIGMVTVKVRVMVIVRVRLVLGWVRECHGQGCTLGSG